jgi:hypothetical protein
MSESWRPPRPAPGTKPTSFVVAISELRAAVRDLGERLERIEAIIDALVEDRLEEIQARREPPRAS